VRDGVLDGRRSPARVLPAGELSSPSDPWEPGYVVVGVEPGDVALTVAVPRGVGSGGFTQHLERLTLAAGTPRLRHDIVVAARDEEPTSLPDRVRVEGRLVDAATGEGITGWHVRAIGIAGRVRDRGLPSPRAPRCCPRGAGQGRLMLPIRHRALALAARGVVRRVTGIPSRHCRRERGESSA
jgi:hypothetical protein